MNRPSRNVLAIGGAALALVGGGVGGAIAASGSGDPAAERQAFLSDAANRLGVSSAAAAAGRLTKAEADSVKQRIESGRLGAGFGHAGFHRGLRGFGEAAAAYIGVTREQLRQELIGGKSLAQVATEHGKSVDGLKQAIVDAAKKRLDGAVSAGRLTSAQEQNLLDRLKSNIDDLVNQTGLPSGPRG
jgi:hypothetical protein